MSIVQILILALIQGAAELLPVSSSAHVIVAERLMGLDPGAPEMTFLLVMLHTGTMFAVLFYFWKRWKSLLGASGSQFIKWVAVATACTGVLGLGLKKFIEKVVLLGLLHHEKGEIEHLFRNLPLISVALMAAGALIILTGRRETQAESLQAAGQPLDARTSALVGIVQGLCLPFRGFSRSGATISTALSRGVSRGLAEDFSFALAVVLTPPVIALELHRLLKAQGGFQALEASGLGNLLAPGLIGMAFSFGAGLLALRWLSSWLEKGRWKYFGFYCVAFSLFVLLGSFLGL